MGKVQPETYAFKKVMNILLKWVQEGLAHHVIGGLGQLEVHLGFQGLLLLSDFENQRYLFPQLLSKLDLEQKNINLFLIKMKCFFILVHVVKSHKIFM